MANRINFCLGLILIVLSCRSCHSKPFYVDYEEGVEDPMEFYSNLIPNFKSQDDSFLPTSQDQDKSGQGASIVGATGLGTAVKRTQNEIIPEGKTNGDSSWNGKVDGENKKSQIGRMGIKNGSLAGANNGFRGNARAVRRYRYRGAGGFGSGWNSMKNSNAQRFMSAPTPSVFSYSSSFHNYADGNGKPDSNGFSKRQSILYRQCFFNPISCFRK